MIAEDQRGCALGLDASRSDDAADVLVGRARGRAALWMPIRSATCSHRCHRPRPDPTGSSPELLLRRLARRPAHVADTLGVEIEHAGAPVDCAILRPPDPVPRSDEQADVVARCTRSEVERRGDLGRARSSDRAPPRAPSGPHHRCRHRPARDPRSRRVKPDERGFEDAITGSLVEAGGYRVCKWGTKPEWAGDFDPKLGLDTAELLAFIAETQPAAWKRLLEVHGGPDGRPPAVRRPPRQAARRAGRGRCPAPRRQRPRDRGPPRVLQARPRPDARADRAVPRQPPDRHPPAPLRGRRPTKTLDLCLFVNGIPVATAELKNPLTHQTVEHAKKQYREDRDPANVTLGRRALVHFAVDPNLVEMTTRLEGLKTRFLPFNRGDAGGKGNAPDPTGHRTRYLWEEIWARDAWLDLLGRFIHVEPGEGSDARGQAQGGLGHLPPLPPVGRRPPARGDRPRRGSRSLVPRPALGGLGQEQHHRLARPSAHVAPRDRRQAGLRQGRRHHRPGRSSTASSRRRSTSSSTRPASSPGSTRTAPSSRRPSPASRAGSSSRRSRSSRSSSTRSPTSGSAASRSSWTRPTPPRPARPPRT